MNAAGNNRVHRLNPSVTVIMHTSGMHQESIGRAVGSFCRQGYGHARLLVVNTHPQALRLEGLPTGAAVSVLNMQDRFRRPVEQYVFGLGLVESDCWTILDDDDWIEAGHLAGLVGQWNACTDRTAAPLQVCGQNVTGHYEDGPRVLRFKGWCCSLFERLTAEELDWCFRRFPQGRISGADSWIAGNSYYDRRLFEGAASYHWDRTGSAHVSAHEARNEDKPEDAYWYAANYWRMKLEAHRQALAPVVVEAADEVS
jgi:hypothetical protein